MKTRFSTVVGLAAGLLMGVAATVQAQDMSFLTNGLVAYYPLNGDANDYSGYGNDGTFVNVLTVPDRFGTPGGAAFTTGDTSYVQIPNSSQLMALEAENEITISFWGRISIGGAVGICKYNQSTDGGWEFGYNDVFGGGVGWLLDQNPWPFYTPDTYYDRLTAIPLSWIHLVATGSHSSQKVRFYVDGQPFLPNIYINGQPNFGGQPVPCTTATNFHLGASGGPLYLNYSPLGPDEFQVGQIDDLRIYSRALSEIEVRNLYDFESNANLTNTGPIIVGQPIGQALYVGDSAEMLVEARGSWPLNYQWWQNGAAMAGATNAMLVLTNVTLADAGEYAVVVSNEFGSVTSAVAGVTVTERQWPHFENFEGSVGPEWSHRQVDTTPVGNRRFLGQFGNDTVSLTLNGLPPHQAVTVSFDLFIIETWDGNDDPDGGPDIWDLSVADGPTLLHTTFLIWPWWGDAAKQAFPGDYPGGAYPARTGAVENDTLGYGWVGDAVYSLTFTFPHRADALRFDFSGQGLEGVADESWGLDNVRVELTPADGVPYVTTSVASTGTWLPTGSLSVNAVSVSGTHALVAVGDSEVRLLDISNPAAPAFLGSWSTFLSLSDAVLVGDFAYIASWEADFLSTVEIVDFTDPTQPVLRGYFDTPGYAQELLIRNNLAYVADSEGGLSIFNVEDPAWPRRLGGYDTKGSVQHVEISGSYAYVPDGNWLSTLDVSDPYNPRRASLYEVASGISSLKAYGTRLYLSERTGTLRILSVGDAANIQLLETYQGWGSPSQAIAVSGRYLYLAKGTGGLHVLDVSDSAKPTYLTGAWSSPAEDVALMGKYAVVAGGEKGLMVYEVKQHLYPPLQAPVISAGTMTLTWATTNDVRLQKANNLITPVWQDVPESEGTNTVTLPVTKEMEFFRLVKAPRLDVPDGLIGWWPGDGTPLDVSGHGNHGIPQDVAYTEGVVGQAFAFNGAGYVYVDSTFPFHESNDATLAFWMLYHPPGGFETGAFWTRSDVTDANRFNIFMANQEYFGGQANQFIVDYRTPAGDLRLHFGPVLTVDTWMHLAVTRSGNAYSIYVNGDFAEAMSDSSPDLPTSTGWMMSGWGNPNLLEGALDEVMLFNRALSEAEIKVIYDSGSAGLARPSP